MTEFYFSKKHSTDPKKPLKVFRGVSIPVVPSLPDNLQSLPPEQQAALVEKYIHFHTAINAANGDPIDLSRLEAVRWAVQHGRVSDSDGSKTRHRFGWRERLQRRLQKGGEKE